MVGLWGGAGLVDNRGSGRVLLLLLLELLELGLLTSDHLQEPVLLKAISQWNLTGQPRIEHDVDDYRYGYLYTIGD